MSDAPRVSVEDDGIYYRASAILSCPRALLAARLGYEPKYPPQAMQDRFDDGHLHEGAIIDKLAQRHNITVSDREQTVIVHAGDYYGNKVYIRGHIDGITSDGRLLEMKTMSQLSFEKWQAKRFEAFPNYAAQTAVYMQATGLPMLLVAKNKNSGQLDLHSVDKPQWDVADLFNRIGTVETFAQGTELPDCPKTKDYPCPYYYLEDGPDVPATTATLDTDLIDLAARYAELKATKDAADKELKPLREEILGKIGPETRVQAGNYLIKATPYTSTRVNMNAIRELIDISPYETSTPHTRLEIEGKADAS